MAKLINGLVQIPSSIPVRKPVYLVHGNEVIAFNEIKENENGGLDLLMRYQPYSLVIEGLELTEDAKRFCRWK
jgi:hypothetical protein